MGGEASKVIYEPNKNNKGVINRNEELWSTVIKLQGEHAEDFAFSAREVARRADIGIAHTLITRNRGGLTKLFRDLRDDFAEKLHQLVADECTNYGMIDIRFCRNLGFLISSYYALFTMDVISSSHRNTELVVDMMKPLLEKKNVLYFGAEFYMLLKDWSEEKFARGSVMGKYERRIQTLLHKYQIIRPDMSVVIRGASNDASDNNAAMTRAQDGSMA